MHEPYCGSVGARVFLHAEVPSAAPSPNKNMALETKVGVPGIKAIELPRNVQEDLKNARMDVAFATLQELARKFDDPNTSQEYGKQLVFQYVEGVIIFLQNMVEKVPDDPEERAKWKAASQLVPSLLNINGRGNRGNKRLIKNLSDDSLSQAELRYVNTKVVQVLDLLTQYWNKVKNSDS